MLRRDINHKVNVVGEILVRSSDCCLVVILKHVVEFKCFFLWGTITPEKANASKVDKTDMRVVLHVIILFHVTLLQIFFVRYASFSQELHEVR